MRSSYRIVDEPAPGALSHLAVNPIFPLLSVMLVGIGLAWPWFLLNGLALGSATRLREALLVVAGFAGAAVLPTLGDHALVQPWLTSSLMPYAELAGLVWALGISYGIHTTQLVGVQIFEHSGGSVRNGAGVLIAGVLLVKPLVLRVPALAWLFW